jgi:hypothetical protein
MKRLSYAAACRIAPFFLALPVIAFVVFTGWMWHTDRVYVPNSSEFKTAEAFVRTNDLVKKEFGDLVEVSKGERWKWELTGESRTGFFSFAIKGTKDNGVIDVYWHKPTSDAALAIREIRRSDPWTQSRVLFKSE